MGLFTKPTYVEMELPFYLVIWQDMQANYEAGNIDIESCGFVDGQKKYFMVCYSLSDMDMYDNGAYEEILALLKNPGDRTVKLRLKYKGERLKSFKLDLQSLSDAYGDERFLSLELLGWGINDTSYMYK